MPKKNLKLNNFSIPALLNQYSTGTSMIHYTNQQNQRCAFIGITPINIYYCDKTDSSILNKRIQTSLKNKSSIWVAATSYEWGCNQLPGFNVSNPTGVFIEYGDGFWLNFDTDSCEPFGQPTIPVNIPSMIKTPQIKLQPQWTQHDFASAINNAQKAITEGDIYQINLSYPSIINTNQSIQDIYQTITENHIPPYSAYIHTDRVQIASLSPEEFFTIENGMIRTRPIKGTIGRHSDDALDQAAYQTLMNSEKDKAELIMITDLLRNDLGQCAIPGSVNVTDLCKIQSYEYVYHLVSTITAKLQPSLSTFDALKLLAPGGSITGCPKHSACQSIQSIESFPRHFYTGHIGFFTGSGDAAFNVAIRTCYQIDDGPIMTHSGCGITIDSDPNQEFQETLDKQRFITDYVNVI